MDDVINSLNAGAEVPLLTWKKKKVGISTTPHPSHNLLSILAQIFKI
jgi:hypothetical protein